MASARKTIDTSRDKIKKLEARVEEQRLEIKILMETAAALQRPPRSPVQVRSHERGFVPSSRRVMR